MATLGLRSNHLPVAVYGVELLLIFAITYTGVGQLLFGTLTLPSWVWIIMLPFAITFLGLEELRK